MLQRTGPNPVVPTRSALEGLASASRRSTHTALVAPPVRPRRNVRAQRRRRDILVGLIAAMVISLVLGALPALRIIWVVHLLADALFVTYIGLLVRMRNAAAEREMNRVFVPGPTRVEPALLYRRSAN